MIIVGAEAEKSLKGVTGNEGIKNWGFHVVETPRSFDGGDSTHHFSPNDGFARSLICSSVKLYSFNISVNFSFVIFLCLIFFSP